MSSQIIRKECEMLEKIILMNRNQDNRLLIQKLAVLRLKLEAAEN